MSKSILKWSLLLLFAFYKDIQVNAIQCEVVNSTHTGKFKKCDKFCFAVWFNKSGVINMQLKGCWQEIGVNLRSTNTCEGVTLTRHGVHKQPIVCKCNTDLCNVNLTWRRDASAYHPTKATTMHGTQQHKKANTDQAIIIAVVAIISTLIILLIVLMVYMKKRAPTKHTAESISKGSEIEILISSKELPPIDLKDVLSQGQFCTVRKGRMGYKNVAVKIFPITQGKPTPSALTEKGIYKDCKLSHENILKFIGEHFNEEGSQQQLWLVTEYIDQGSLSDFLKRNLISWENLFHMARGMALGMAYLHVEIPKIKPSIAHRDIKSKNILVKNNLTCCISDFGLSLKFDDKDGPGDTHGQVGTRRYMAPEVLEGAINFSREAFLRIDMYALALCLWELLTRCTAVQEEPVGEYKLPFEKELGVHPSLDELQDFVVNKKSRPKFADEWKDKAEAIDGIIVTIEECWDHDADARLTADCVAERISQLCSTAKRQTNTPQSVSFKPAEQESPLLA